MNATNLGLEPTADSDLAQFIEPLASYICAADRPREVLLSVLAALRNEVKQTNQAAHLHFSARHPEAVGLAS